MPTESPYISIITKASAILLFTVLGVGAFRVRRRNAAIRNNWPPDSVQNSSGQHFRHLSRIKAESKSREREGCIGYRYAYMVERDGRVYFASIHAKAVFSTSTDAQCLANTITASFERKPHTKSPYWECKCGFHSLIDVTDLPYRASVSCSARLIYLLEVSLSGTIIPAELGYRAEHQEVVRVWLPARCAKCNASPAGLGTDDELGVIMCRDKARDRGLVPVCKHHSKRADSFYDINDLRDLFGTEFEWLDPTV